jgi:hypothetical protein
MSLDGTIDQGMIVLPIFLDFLVPELIGCFDG